MSEFSIRAISKKRWMVIGGALLGVLLLLAAILFAINSQGAPPAATAETKPTPIAQPAIVAPTPPDTIAAESSFQGWSTQPGAEAGVKAESGRSGDGLIALRLTSDAVGSVLLSQTVELVPGQVYQLSAMLRPSDGGSDGESVSISVGAADPVALVVAKDSDEWELTEWEYTATEQDVVSSISVVASSSINGIRIDALSMTAAGSDENLVLNGSFEDYATPAHVVNETLIMQTGTAHVGIAARASAVDWAVTDSMGAQVTSGSADLSSGLGLIPLGDLREGYYSISMSSAEAALPRDSVSFMVLDEATPSEPDSRFGTIVHLWQPYYIGADQIAQQVGFTHARTDAIWTLTEVERGIFAFPAAFDSFYADYAARGIDMLPISVYDNENYDDGRTPSSPEAIQAYSNYTSEVVRHYGVSAIEIYNEFNHEPFNDGACGRSAECYLELLRPTSEKLKAEFPNVKVVGPANARQDQPFLDALFAAGGLNYLDAVSFHPYEDEYNGGPEFLVPNLARVNESILAHNDGVSKPIWISELGWTTSLVSEDLQADHLVRAQAIALANNVERFYWYDLVNDDVTLDNPFGNFGMFRQGSAELPAFEPKPAAMAQALLIRKLTGKSFSARDALNESTYSYAYGVGENATRIAWAMTPTTVRYAAKKPLTITDQFGAVSTVDPAGGFVTLELGTQAIYVEGSIGGAELLG